MADHTPGPWRVKTWEGEHGKMTGVVTTTTTVLGGQYVREADACLIAAAPDLLDAGTYAVATSEDPDQTNHRRAMELLRAAIAKAKGESTG